MKQVFEKTYKINSDEVLINQQLNPVKLIDYLNDIAGYHSESAGYSMVNLFRKGYSWIVLSWNIAIDRMPHSGDTIKIETWISEIKRCFAYREFSIKNEQDEVLCSASSRWVFYNLNRQRLERIPLKLAEHWPVKSIASAPESILDSELLKDSCYEIEEKTYTVQRSDIDILNHAHNSRYIAWIMEGKPENIKEGYSLKHLHIFYHHEIKFPSEIIVQQKIFSQLNKRQYLIKDEICDRGKEIMFSEVVTQWGLSE